MFFFYLLTFSGLFSLVCTEASHLWSKHKAAERAQVRKLRLVDSNSHSSNNQTVFCLFVFFYSFVMIIWFSFRITKGSSWFLQRHRLPTWISVAPVTQHGWSWTAEFYSYIYICVYQRPKLWVLEKCKTSNRLPNGLFLFLYIVYICQM